MSTPSNSSSESLDSGSLGSVSPIRSELSGTADDCLYVGLHHVNLLVPPQTLHLAHAFYAGTLGLTPTMVPPSSKAYLAWFNIADSGQQIHISSQHFLNQTQSKAQAESPRHPCFKIPSQQKLELLQARIWQHYVQGGEGAPVYSDEPGKANQKSQGAAGEFPQRFFARDYAGNRLEFSL